MKDGDEAALGRLSSEWWSRVVGEGFGDQRPDLDDDVALRWMDDLALAGQVQQMGLAEYGQHRARYGLDKDMFSHLAGL